MNFDFPIDFIVKCSEALYVFFPLICKGKY